MITDVTEKLIQRTIDEGGKVYAYTDTEKIEVISANGSDIVLKLDSHVLSVGDTIRFLYEPLFKSPYESMLDTDGDGILDQFDLDADGDGVWDDRAPDLPSHIVLSVTHDALAPDDVTLDISPLEVDEARSRLWGVPIIVDRYYPIYITEEEALLGSPLAPPTAHSHFLDGKTYWMPDGVDLWHGNYHTCMPEPPDEISVESVETYDFEYVDRIYGDYGFNSIVPRDYARRLLAVDTDENGTFDTDQFYELQDIFNVGEEYRHNHYLTRPQQAWMYEVISVQLSEDALPEGHSFKLSNFVYEVRLTTKFELNSEDNINHTLSVFKYLSQLANGSAATMDSSGGGIVKYVNDDDEWTGVSALELNEGGYVILDERLFENGDQFYIHTELPPQEPSNVTLETLSEGDAPSDVRAIGSDINAPSMVNGTLVIQPNNVSDVRANEVVAPDDPPTLVVAGILADEPSEVNVVSSVRFPSHVSAITEPSSDPSDVIAQEIFDPATLNLVHWYDASDTNSQIP